MDTLTKYCVEAIARTKWDRAEIEEHQNKKLQELLEYIKHKSQWYKTYLEGVEIEKINVSNFGEVIPNMTRKKMMKNWDQICTNNQLELREVRELVKTESKRPRSNYTLANGVTILSSSGSQNYPGIFAYSKEEWMQYCSQFARSFENRKALAYRCAHISTNSRLYARPKSSDLIKDRFSNYIDIDATKSSDEIIKCLEVFEANLIIAMPSIIGKVLKNKGARNIKKPELLKLGSQELRPELIKRIKEIWPSTVIENAYGGSEGFGGIARTEELNKFYLNEDFCIFEINGDKGLTVTNLFNKTMPIIRMKISDQVESWGREREVTDYRWVKIKSRKEAAEFIIDGRKLSSLRFDEVINHYSEAGEIQIEQVTDGFIIRTSNELEMKDKNQMMTDLKSMIKQKKVSCKFEIKTEEGVLEPSGKKKKYKPLE